jgi:hypothetical protein
VAIKNVTKPEEAIMSTLTYSHNTAIGAEPEAVAKTARTSRQGFWRRAFDAMVAAQQKRAEREVAAYLSSRGGLFTDDMEREIMQRLSGNKRRSV